MVGLPLPTCDPPRATDATHMRVAHPPHRITDSRRGVLHLMGGWVCHLHSVTLGRGRPTPTYPLQRVWDWVFMYLWVSHNPSGRGNKWMTLNSLAVGLPFLGGGLGDGSPLPFLLTPCSLPLTLLFLYPKFTSVNLVHRCSQRKKM